MTTVVRGVTGYGDPPPDTRPAAQLSQRVSLSSMMSVGRRPSARATPAEAAVWLGVTPTTNRSGRTVPLKTTASAATVDLLPALVRELRAHRARRAALGIQLVRAEALSSPR